MSEQICAPNKYDPDNNTCFSTEQLMEMSRAYNRYITKNKLNPSQLRSLDINLIKVVPDKKKLLVELKKRFDEICNDEICLTKQAFMNEIVQEMKDEIENNVFRHDGPKNSQEWLSTTDIDNIMSQYETIHSDFIFFGAVPLDCNELSFCSIFRLNFDEYYQNKIKKLAIIFNLDRHGQPGSHWVALYIDLKKGHIYFCDSNGKAPIDNINQVINQFINYYQNKTGKKAIYKYNQNGYQKDNSECGVYSCNFIIRLLAGEKFEQIVTNPLKFREINSCRNIYFRNKSSQYTPHANCEPKLSNKN